jgi:hypothetical protein
MHGLLSQRRIVVEVPNELAARSPHVADVFPDRLRRQIRRYQMLEERTEQSNQLLAGQQIFIQPPFMSAASRSGRGSNVPDRGVAQGRRGLSCWFLYSQVSTSCGFF